ncbi:MAG: CZB domain-containing protein [Gammaproteobacteria bacterium]
MANFSNFMAQHVLYINGIQKCLRHNTVFAHKQPDECAFGKMFYAEIKPGMNAYSDEKRRVIEELEKTHNAFHDSANHIVADNPELEQHTREAWFYSSKLINMLGVLEKMSD